MGFLEIDLDFAMTGLAVTKITENWSVADDVAPPGSQRPPSLDECCCPATVILGSLGSFDL
jgi:hypothetical protein